MSNRSCLAFFAVLLTSIPAAPQSGSCLPFEPDNTIEWPIPPSAYGSAAAFGRIVLAELDGDDAAEGVVLAGGVAVMIQKVAVYDALHSIEFGSPPVNVADLATLHGAGPLGPDGVLNTDGVLMTDSRGLFLVTYSFETGFQDPVPIDESDWVNAAPIHVDYLDHDNHEDVLGVSANRRSFLCLFADGSGGFTDPTKVTLPYDILDVVAVNWNRSVDGEREIVALTRRGLYVYGKNATTGELELQQNVLFLALAGCITRIATDADCHERLAWVRSTNTAAPFTSELLVIAQEAPPPPGSVFATPKQSGPWALTLNLCGTTQPLLPIALLAGDYDENQMEDLLVVHELNQTALMLRNVGAIANYFDPGDAADREVIALTNSASEPGNVGLPAFEQLDDHGREDLVFPVAASGKIEVFQGLPYTTTPPPVVTQPFTSAGIIRDKTLYGAGDDVSDGKSRLRFNFEVPEALDTYTHIDMTIWLKPSDSIPMQQHAVYHARHELDRTGPSDPIGLPEDRHQWILIEPPGTISATELFPPEVCWDPRPYFYTEFRFLKIGSGSLTRSRIFAGGFTLKDCVAGHEYSYLTDDGIPGYDFPLKDLYFVPDPTSFSERQALGAFVPMSRVPYFNDEVIPIPGLLSTGSAAQIYDE